MVYIKKNDFYFTPKNYCYDYFKILLTTQKYFYIPHKR